MENAACQEGNSEGSEERFCDEIAYGSRCVGYHKEDGLYKADCRMGYAQSCTLPQGKSISA